VSSRCLVGRSEPELPLLNIDRCDNFSSLSIEPPPCWVKTVAMLWLSTCGTDKKLQSRSGIYHTSFNRNGVGVEFKTGRSTRMSPITFNHSGLPVSDGDRQTTARERDIVRLIWGHAVCST
jgi:hypothetical protein